MEILKHVTSSFDRQCEILAWDRNENAEFYLNVGEIPSENAVGSEERKVCVAERFVVAVLAVQSTKFSTEVTNLKNEART